ncbi:uncharacterized protein DUF3422 [Rhizobium azibense]|uniref:Uncharacterized protein DUF3422 n=1 Tax=Rhizobium azibense TaxID=1136135 RepID=A0A4R3RK30_9HYPH|nr:uncharacterized protein DUF3422 [Rhizobium azibense]
MDVTSKGAEEEASPTTSVPAPRVSSPAACKPETADFNSELHARQSIYFDGPAIVEQVKIQRAVEGFLIIAISYYLLSLLKFVYETPDHAGFHIDPVIMLVAVPIVVGAVAITILRVKHALKDRELGSFPSRGEY